MKWLKSLYELIINSEKNNRKKNAWKNQQYKKTEINSLKNKKKIIKKKIN